MLTTVNIRVPFMPKSSSGKKIGIVASPEEGRVIPSVDADTTIYSVLESRVRFPSNVTAF